MCKGKYSGWHLTHNYGNWDRKAIYFNNGSSSYSNQRQERICKRCNYRQTRDLA